MKRLIGRFMMTAVAVTLAATIWAVQPAGATTLVMTLTDVTGATSNSCDNGIGGCSAGWSGAIDGPTLQFAGTVGSWTTSLTAATTNTPGDTSGALLDLTQLSLKNTTGSARDFEIVVTGRGYTTPGGDPLVFFGSASTSSAGVTGTVVTTSYFDPADTGAQVNPVTCSFTNGSNGSCGTPEESVNNGGGSYSMTEVLDVKSLGAGQTINLTGNTTANTPEPGSLMLLGAGLIGLAGFARRRTKG